jgi:flagellar assembly protein FliH
MNRIIPGSRAFLGEPLAFDVWEIPAPSSNETRADDHECSGRKVEDTFDEKRRAEIEQQINEQIQTRLAESYREGYADGQEAARREAAQTLQQVRQNFVDIIQKVTSERQRLWQEMEEFAVKLSLGIAKRIVQQTTEENERLALAVAQMVISQAMEAEVIALRLNPQDMATLQESKEALPSISGAVEIKSDPRISRGGCIVETRMGDFDGRLETQLQIIYERLMQDARAGNTGGLAQPEQAATKQEKC